jgi:divalent metal cation (Fe/Co/Zn/Cd) transporter
LAERHHAIARVLFRVLLLNLAVAAAKLILGYATGAVSVISDGFHSLTDCASNDADLPQIADAIIHIEPPPAPGHSPS